MRIFGHRGASHDFPENTLPAFEAAVAQGADGVELDVMRCRSGELVVCHDEVLGRLAGVPLVVAETDWADLARLDVGSPLGFGPARLSTLGEVFDRLPGAATVNVELKCESADDGGLSEAVGRLLVERREEGRALVSSFNPVCLERVAAAAPGLRRGLLLDPDRPLEPQLQWLPRTSNATVHPHHSHCTPERVRDFLARGLEVVVWTVDDAVQARALAAMGVWAVITNVPGALKAALRAA